MPNICKQENMSNIGKDNKYTLAFYHADWCQHCKKFEKDVWNDFVQSTNIKNLNLIMVNFDENKELCQNEMISGLPTIILYKPTGEKLKYNGQRSLKDLKEFIHDQMSDNDTQPSDELILYYTNWCGHSKNFINNAWNNFKNDSRINDLSLTVSEIDCDQNSDKCKSENILGFPTVILRKKNGTSIEFNDERSADKLREFVQKNRS